MDDFENAKKILSHPNFNRLSPEQIQQTFALILATGLTKNDITLILKDVEIKRERLMVLKQNISRLEALPRDVLKYLVEIGEIKGRDLLNLCNSSPILRNYCLANSTDINGQVIETEEIYRIALRKMHITLNDNESPKSRLLNIEAGVRNIINLKITYNDVNGEFKFELIPYINQVKEIEADQYILAFTDPNDKLHIYNENKIFEIPGMSKIKKMSIDSIYNRKKTELITIDSDGNLVYILFKIHDGKRLEVIQMKTIKKFRIKKYDLEGKEKDLGERRLKFKQLNTAFNVFLDVNGNLYESIYLFQNDDDVWDFNLIHQKIELFYKEYKSFYVYTKHDEIIKKKVNLRGDGWTVYKNKKIDKIQGRILKMKSYDDKCFYLLEGGYLMDCDHTSFVFQTNILDFELINLTSAVSTLAVVAVDLEGNGLIISAEDSDRLPYGKVIRIPSIFNASKVKHFRSASELITKTNDLLLSVL